MKIIPLILLGVFAGCTSPKTTAVADPRLLGTYCHSSTDALLCIEFKADQTWDEQFESFAMGTTGGPRGHGRWQQKADQVLLFPEHGPRRVLHMVEEKGALALLEMKDSKVIRTYRR